jgi:hypothetical protein
MSDPDNISRIWIWAKFSQIHNIGHEKSREPSLTELGM